MINISQYLKKSIYLIFLQLSLHREHKPEQKAVSHQVYYMINIKKAKTEIT